MIEISIKYLLDNVHESTDVLERGPEPAERPDVSLARRSLRDYVESGDLVVAQAGVAVGQDPLPEIP